jgi:ABC-type uncharacterized transport system involved in gliding motility auxiliary subunit
MMLSFTASAQQDKAAKGHNDNQAGGKHEKIESQRIAFITQQVDLTPDEAKAFWPVYNEYETKRHDLRKNFNSGDDFHKPDYTKITEKDASQLLDKQITEAQKAMDLRKEYLLKFRSILPAVKVLKLQDAERDFQKMLIDKLREHKDHQQPVEKTK